MSNYMCFLQLHVLHDQFKIRMCTISDCSHKSMQNNGRGTSVVELTGFDLLVKANCPHDRLDNLPVCWISTGSARDFVGKRTPVKSRNSSN